MTTYISIFQSRIALTVLPVPIIRLALRRLYSYLWHVQGGVGSDKFECMVVGLSYFYPCNASPTRYLAPLLPRHPPRLSMAYSPGLSVGGLSADAIPRRMWPCAGWATASSPPESWTQIDKQEYIILTPCPVHMSHLPVLPAAVLCWSKWTMNVLFRDLLACRKLDKETGPGGG